ncbi:Fanconi anemia group I protein-like isoform X2 [Dreissena polymorpha]|nr:Fanconi anemia group I protein-like isoform X2 [Dreissena polymorpha]XP_052249478.1 Fanconi anemia group I protein-like isoform X2 [Dreissena polymorpha]
MDKKITNLAEENKTQELIECLERIPNQELGQMIEQKVIKGRNDTFTLVRAILLGSPPENSSSVERRCHVYKQCISALQKYEVNNKMASELVGLLMLEADTLPGTTLAELAGIYLDNIKSDVTLSTKSLELFPKILSAISAQENIHYAGNHMKGTDYKGRVLNSMCSCRWDPKSVINLAAMFKDVPLSNEELKFVIEKILRMFGELDMSDIPALVYQLLLLCTKGHKKLVLEGIIKFFSEQDSKQKPADEMECSEDVLEMSSDNVESLRMTEGTVILHISLAVKEHQELGREFIKCLKGYQNCGVAKILSPFSLAMTLSLARINRFEDQIYEFLKSSILKSFKDAEKQSTSFWVKEIVPETSLVEEYILQTVKNSTFGWDHVIQGLVQLGFILMDSFGPKAAFGRLDLVPTLLSGPSHEACQLGAKILLKTFKAHEMVRSEILDQIFNRVITKATTPVNHFLGLLGDIVVASPSMLLDNTAKIREMFDYLSMLSPGSAEGLLGAVQPLLKLSMSLKDALMLVLRKAMFARQLESRKIGAGGFLMILKHFRVLGGLRSSQASQPSFSASQVEVDVHHRVNPSSNEALCLEILGNLRRCLSQQADVRLLLYQGLTDVLDRNTQLREPILSMLLVQLRQFYEGNTEVLPPIRLEPCIVAQGDQVFLAEPLAHLVCCIQQCLVKSAEILRKSCSGNDNESIADEEEEEEGEECEVQKELEGMMNSVVERMITAEMEDFELDKSADYSLANSVGIRNNIFAILVLGTYESLMEYTFLSGKLNESRTRQLLQLFENYKKLSDVLRERASAAAGKKGKTAVKPPQSLLSLKVVTAMLDVMLSKDRHRDDVRESLRMKDEFLKYLLTVTFQKLGQIQDRGQCEGLEGKSKPRIFEHLCHIARLLLGYYVENQKLEGEQRVREKQLLTLTLESLATTFSIATQQFAKDLKMFLDGLEVEGCEKAQTLDAEIYFHVKFIQRLVMDMFSADEDHQCLKAVGLLLSVIVQLSKTLGPEFTDCDQILAWFYKLAQEQTIDDLSLVKSLLSSLMLLGQKWQGAVVILRDLAQDIHCQIGDIDSEIELDSPTNFAIVTARSAAPTVLQLVLAQCERELDDTDWVITRGKADHAATCGDLTGDASQLTQREGNEKSICMRLGMLVNTFHELVQTALPQGPCSEQLMKVLIRVYGSLASLVKYYLWMYGQSSGHMSARFEKLVKLSGTNLTQHCYAFITYIQTVENEKVQQAAPDKGKKKKDDKKGTGNAQKASVMKQTRTIPNLIYAIEQYERYLIQLTKKSKVNLMEHMKHSTSRDFRINANILAQADDSSGNEVSSEDDANQTGADNTQNNEEPETTVVSDQSDSDQENNQSAANVSTTTQEPVKKKSKLGGRGKVGKTKT